MKTKQCGSCTRTLTEDNFYDKKRSKVRKDGTIHRWVGKYSSCKDCVNGYNNEAKEKYADYYKEYRVKNKAKKAQQTTEHYIKTKLEWISLIRTIKDLKCERCGYDKNFAALDFHHLNPKEKEHGIHSLMNKKVPTEERWEEMQKELDKCIVLCANCHREEHSRHDFFKLEKEA